MRKLWKKTFPIALAASCVLAVSVPAMAREIDPDRTGSISVSIRAYATDDAVGGGSLQLYQVAGTTVTATEGAVYHYTDSFAGCSEDLLTGDELARAETAEAFCEWVDTHDVGADRTASVSSAGETYFSDLACGLYLIAQDEAADGYNAINAFLVSVPLEEDGEWIYDVDATPKTSPATKADEPKKSEPDNGNPDSGNPNDQNPDGTGGTGTTGSGTTGGTGTTGSGTTGSGTSSGSTTSANAKTGDYDYYVYGAMVIGAALVIVAVLRRRAKRSAQ